MNKLIIKKNMKKKALMLVIVLAASFLAQATNDNEVIMSIKENYYSIKEKWDDLYKYKSFSNESDISLYSENEVLTAENHFCVVLNERSTIYEYYVKANKLYFVFSNNNGIENRYYFNSNNEIIRWLDNEKLEIDTGLNEKSKSLFNKLILVDSKSDIINEFTSSISVGLSKQIIVDSVKPSGSGLFQVVYEYKNIAFLLIFILLVIILYFKSRTNISATNITEPDEQNTRIYGSGEKYVGEYRDGMRHGFGVFTKSNASANLSPGELIVISTYEGEWKDDSKCGEGSFVKEYKDGDTHHSFGEKYVGGWKSDKYHGGGKLTSSTGDIYDGDWKLGIKDGGGVMTYTNGNRYEGGMKDGEMHGKGKYSVDGYGIFVGDFVNGVITGKGVFNYSNGEKYDGEWKDAKRHGKGVYTFSDGFEYNGLWDVGFFIDGKKRINVTDSEYKKSKKIADLKFKGKGKYQIKLMGKGVNYIEMWMDKDRLDEIGEENIDAEYFEDNLINGERIIDISGVIVESGFKIKIDALDSASKEPEIIEGNVHMEFINDTVDELCYESDEFADVFEDQAEADYHDFDENKVLIQYIQVERGAYFEFQMEDFELSKFQLYPWCLERFNDFDIIIGGVYDGKKIDFEFGDCTGVRNELRIIHHPDNIEYEWDY